MEDMLDPDTFQLVPNPYFRFKEGNFCVVNCSGKLLLYRNRSAHFCASILYFIYDDMRLQFLNFIFALLGTGAFLALQTIPHLV